MVLDPNVRDEVAAFIESDDERLKIVRTLERKGESITTDVFLSIFPHLSKDEVISPLKQLEQKGVLKCLAGAQGEPQIWELTMLGHEVLYALEKPVRAHPPHRIFRALADTIRNTLKRPAKKPATPSPNPSSSTASAS